ncbi:MAG: sulfur carrier protein ThiS adenylyltransferase ThiF [Candidatus Omnitrophica bacterium]|nr:sulfur carrier protein ThiS adenylyltransferase ThiF [Candidatus Omnitrophota bacterium]
MNSFEQGLLRYLTENQLKRIQSKTIGIGGAGGLGSNIALTLVRCGFKNLEILDSDVVEASNLNRQQFSLEDIGKDKVIVLKKRLRAINPDAQITTHKILWSLENSPSFFNGCDFILEAFDHAECKRDFVEYYQDKTPHLISGNGMAGLLQKKPITIKTIGNIHIVGDNTTDIADGHPPMAPRVTICAAMMAEIVLDLSLMNFFEG